MAHLGPLRIALYLDSALPSRTSLFRRMRTSYSARSGIVHGELGPKLRTDLPNLESDTEAALRLALQRTVLAGHAPSQAELETLELKVAESARAPDQRET
jgi:hypothetical protein